MVRNANRNDFEQIRKIKPTISEKILEERLKFQGEDKANFLVLEKNGILVSFVFLKWYGKDTHPEYPDIEDLYTMESERGKGYGSELIIECERLAIEKGFNKIGLAVNFTLNKNALHLYERLGYVHDGGPSYMDGVYDGTEDWCIDQEKTMISCF